MSVFRCYTLVRLMACVALSRLSTAFVSPPILPIHLHQATTPIHTPVALSSGKHGETVTQEQQALLSSIRSMRVKEIKLELESRQISTVDVFEKEELVQRLLAARQQKQPTSKQSSTPTSSSAGTKGGSVVVLSTHLYLTSLKEQRVAAVNMPDGQGITIGPGEQPYATIQLDVTQKNGKTFTLSLLLDTACSGFVLRPSVQAKYTLPSFQTPVTMTGAGGVSSATGLTQLDSFCLSGETNTMFGPLPAVVQDIGALPPSLDGILGLSFLSQFASVEFDFTKGVVNFLKQTPSSSGDANDANVASRGPMRMLGSLGIFVCDVYWGSATKPVTMLVDTGASCTLLNWKGVADLGLTKDSPALSRIPTPFGAMGSDNVAIALTHRLHVSSKFGVSGSGDGIQLSRRLAIDVGSIPVIDNLKREGVGGILGVDALLQCSKVTVSCREPLQVTLYQ